MTSQTNLQLAARGSGDMDSNLQLAPVVVPPPVCVVVTTVFEDDYKPRGDWSWTESVDVFSSEKAALDYKKQAQINYINKCENDKEEVNEKFFHKVKEATYEFWEMKDMEDVDILLEYCTAGEYVETTVKWEVFCKTPETTHPEPTTKTTYEDDEDEKDEEEEDDEDEEDDDEDPPPAPR